MEQNNLSETLEHELEHLADVALIEQIGVRRLDVVTNRFKELYLDKLSKSVTGETFEDKAYRFVEYYLNTYYQGEEFRSYRSDKGKEVCSEILIYVNATGNNDQEHIRRYLAENKIMFTPDWYITACYTSYLIVAYYEVTSGNEICTDSRPSHFNKHWSAQKKHILTLVDAVKIF